MSSIRDHTRYGSPFYQYRITSLKPLSLAINSALDCDRRIRVHSLWLGR